MIATSRRQLLWGATAGAVACATPALASLLPASGSLEDRLRLRYKVHALKPWRDDIFAMLFKINRRVIALGPDRFTPGIEGSGTIHAHGRADFDMQWAMRDPDAHDEFLNGFAEDVYERSKLIHGKWHIPAFAYGYDLIHRERTGEREIERFGKTCDVVSIALYGIHNGHHLFT